MKVSTGIGHGSDRYRFSSVKTSGTSLWTVGLRNPAGGQSWLVPRSQLSRFGASPFSSGNSGFLGRRPGCMAAGNCASHFWMIVNMLLWSMRATLATLIRPWTLQSVTSADPPVGIMLICPWKFRPGWKLRSMTSRMRELNNLRHTPVAQFDPKGPRTQGLNVVPMPMEGIATRDELVASELLPSMLQMCSPEGEPWLLVLASRRRNGSVVFGGEPWWPQKRLRLV